MEQRQKLYGNFEGGNGGVHVITAGQHGAIVIELILGDMMPQGKNLVLPDAFGLISSIQFRFCPGLVLGKVVVGTNNDGVLGVTNAVIDFLTVFIAPMDLIGVDPYGDTESAKILNELSNILAVFVSVGNKYVKLVRGGVVACIIQRIKDQTQIMQVQVAFAMDQSRLGVHFRPEGSRNECGGRTLSVVEPVLTAHLVDDGIADQFEKIWGEVTVQMR